MSENICKKIIKKTIKNNIQNKLIVNKDRSKINY